MTNGPKRPKPTTPMSEKATEAVKNNVLFGTGYARPPIEHQFQKGKPGNPRGRPRTAAKDLTLDEQPLLKSVRRQAERKITAREGGKSVEVPTGDAIVQSIMVNAIKGNARSQGLAMDLITRSNEANARDINRRNELWSRYQELAFAQIEAARERGEPEPVILPHPADIEIDASAGPIFRGPMCEAEQRSVERTFDYLDVLVMQAELEDRTYGSEGSSRTEPRSALHLALLLEKTIPQRLRWSEVEWFRRQNRCHVLSKRELLKRLTRAWRALGTPRARGRLTPHISQIKRLLENLAAMKQEVDAGRLDLDAMARGEFDEAALDFIHRQGLR